MTGLLGAIKQDYGMIGALGMIGLSFIGFALSEASTHPVAAEMKLVYVVCGIIGLISAVIFAGDYR